MWPFVLVSINVMYFWCTPCVAFQVLPVLAHLFHLLVDSSLARAGDMMAKAGNGNGAAAASNGTGGNGSDGQAGLREPLSRGRE